MPTFGELLGAEILEKREEQRLTQLALAQEVFDDENYVRRIGDYETGKVGRPQAKVYRPICDFLGIASARIGELKAQAADAKGVTDDEIAALRAERGSLAQALSELQTLSRAQMETLASRFEMDRPYEASDAGLVDFLSKKAEDYRALRAEIEAIDEGLKQLSNLKAAAFAEIEAGDLEAVEILLERVQEVELEEAAKTAELRANNALLRGKTEQAFRILSAAADSFGAVDPAFPADKRHEYMQILCNHGLRYGGEGLPMSVQMTKDALDLTPNYPSPLYARLQNALAIALRNQGTRTGGAAGAALLAEAVSAYRAALGVYTRDAHPVLWATTQNNLAAALQEQGIRTGGEKGAALLAEAVTAYRAALEVRTRDAHPVQWAMSQNNRGNALSEQGTRTDGEAGAALLAEAVTAYRAALEVTTRDAHPVDWAMTQNNLGAALHDQGTRTGGEKGAALLAEAVTAYRAALEVYTRGAHPVHWALTQENMAMAEGALAEHKSCADPLPHLRAALAHVTSALEVYDPEHMPYDYGTASALKALLEARLAGLG